MKCRVVERPDGTVAVIHPMPGSRHEGETEEEWLERVFTKSMVGELAGLPFTDMDQSEIPTDRSKRHAWRRNGTRVMVDAAVPDLLASSIEERLAELERRLPRVP